MAQQNDPVTPYATFDSYVVDGDGTLRGVAGWFAQYSRFEIIGTIASITVIGAVTFLLGVMVTLGLNGSQEQPATFPEGAETVTRLQTAAFVSPVTPVAAGASIPALEAAVLKGLQPKRTLGKLTADEMSQKALEAQQIVNRNKLRMLREGVLARVYSVTAREDGDQRRLVLKTVNADMTQKAMANLLTEAIKAGTLEVPAALTTADGVVDMDTLLFNLIQTSLANDGTPEGLAAATEMSRRAFAASEAKTKEVGGSRIYVVEPGDSLGYLSLQFYGRPGAYWRIFEANREQLHSPDLIRIGQRLIIPA